MGQTEEWLCNTDARVLSGPVKWIKMNVGLNSRYQNNDDEHVTHFILAMKGQLQRKRDWLFGKESLALRNKQQGESELQTKGSF